MARPKTLWVCDHCGSQSPKWVGRCPECKEWNCLSEAVEAPAGSTPAPSLSDGSRPVRLTDIPLGGGGELRARVGIPELDGVLGGGLVAGSLILVGGDPGVGKSTLWLQAAHHVATRGGRVLYVTGEESLGQVRMRADRLGVSAPEVHLLAHTDFGHIERMIEEFHPTLAVVDSVQTVYLPHLQSVPGSMMQVREVAHRAMVLAKRTGTAIVMIGHVNKSGDLAGPKVLEHYVDTVLYFEGDGRTSLRVIRAVKNRFGASGEIGVFDMVEGGLVEVPDASARLLAERQRDASGTAVTAILEGTRPLLCEIQALVGRPSPVPPARTCVGVDRTRVLMLAAVLEKAGASVHDRDVFVNAAGGVRVEETSADLAVVAAMASSLGDRPLEPNTLLLGEVGLVGEIRAVPHPSMRLKEAARHGFRRVIGPPSLERDLPAGMELVASRSVREVLGVLFGVGGRGGPR